MMVKIKDFVPFSGVHCETTATGNLLKHAGLEISEPMMFGLGEGFGFGIFQFKNMDAPFIGGRSKQEEVTKKLAQHLGIEVEFRFTRSKKWAWENITSFVDGGQPVAVKLDAYYLDYFTTKIHFAAHYLVVWGYDETQVYVVDTNQQGGDLSTDRAAFEEGRLWKGPMASDAMTWTITMNGTPAIEKALPVAIKANAAAYLNPPIRNFGAKGIRKTAKLVPGWAETVSEKGLQQIGRLMERGGTGGALFRNFYRDFLTEANTYLNDPDLIHARDLFAQAAPMWTEVAEKIVIGKPAALQETSDILLEIADIEENAMTILADL